MNSLNNECDDIKPTLACSGGCNTIMEKQSENVTHPGARAFWRGLAALLVVLIVAAFGMQMPVQAAESDAHVIVIDAGHGGQDPGAEDPVNGYTEADLVQEMTDRMGAYFARHGEEVQVVNTHAPGEYVSIGHRTAVANSVDADLLVSMHLNAAENTEADGFQIFPAPPGRNNHAESLQLAEDILPHVREIGRNVRGTNGVFYAFYNGGEKDFYDAVEFNRVDERGSFGVVDGANCPAVLVESWFITNHDDMAFFNTEHGKNLMSRQLYRGICQYLGIEALA